MRWFNVMIKADATRQVNDQAVAGETIQSVFQVRAVSALKASDEAATTFKQDYNGCNLDDLEITHLHVEPHTEEEDES